MTTLDEFAVEFARRTRADGLADGNCDEVPEVDDLSCLYQSMHHQGVPKRAAYLCFPELVELEMDNELWTLWGMLGAGCAWRGRPSGLTDNEWERFRRALDRGRQRLADRLPRAEDDDDAISLLTALAGVRGNTNTHDLLERLPEEIEHRCERCGWRAAIRREGRAILVDGRALSVRAAPESISAPGAALLEAATLVPREDVRLALMALFGPIECPRCGRDYRLLSTYEDVREASPRDDLPRSGERTIELASPLRERVMARLRQMARTPNSPDAIRLAGIGLLTVIQYKGYSGTKAIARVFMAGDEEIAGVINGRPFVAPQPSDDAELDAFAATLLAAFREGRLLSVEVPRFGRFEVLIGTSRNGATVDGEPIVVPARNKFVFRAASELTKALNVA